MKEVEKTVVVKKDHDDCYWIEVEQIPELRLAIYQHELANGVYAKRSELLGGAWGVLTARLRLDETAVVTAIGTYIFTANAKAILPGADPLPDLPELLKEAQESITSDEKYSWMFTYWHPKLLSGVGLTIPSSDADDLLKSGVQVTEETLLTVGSTAVDILSLVFPPALVVGAVVKTGIKIVKNFQSAAEVVSSLVAINETAEHIANVFMMKSIELMKASIPPPVTECSEKCLN